MLFSEAVDALLEGKFVTRPAMKDKGEYCVLLPGIQSIWKILTMPTPNAGNCLFLISDYLADDWEIVDSLSMAVSEIVAA